MDLHIHSKYSFDSKMDMESAVLESVKKGYRVISFTEHIDMDFPGFGNKFDVDFLSYLDEIRSLQKKYRDIEILKGIEAGVTDETIGKVRDRLEGHDLDHVLLSVHVLNGRDPYKDKKLYKDYNKYELYSAYLNKIYQYMVEYNEFNTLGHYDYITRCSEYEDPDMNYEEFKDDFDRIFSYLITNDKTLEINTRTYNGTLYGKRVFDVNILKAYRKLGGRNICLGSDSHDAGSIGYRFEEFLSYIRDAGFEKLTYHKNKEKKYLKI